MHYITALLSLFLPQMKTIKYQNKERRAEKKKEAREAIARARAWALKRRSKRERGRKDDVKKENFSSKKTKMVKFDEILKNEDEVMKRKHLVQHLLQKEEQVLAETKLKIELLKKELDNFVN